MDAPEAQSMRAYYYDRFLPAVDDAMVELAALNKTSSFYVAERPVEGVRVRRNGAPGRFEFKTPSGRRKTARTTIRGFSPRTA